MIDTHAHLDGPEFNDDRAAMMQRAKEAGASKVFIPAIDLPSVQTVVETCRQFEGFAYPMIGLHPEEVKADYPAVLAEMRRLLDANLPSAGECDVVSPRQQPPPECQWEFPPLHRQSAR